MVEKTSLKFFVKILSAVRTSRLHPDATFAREQALSLHNIFFDYIENISSEKILFFWGSEKTVESVNENQVGSQ